MFLLNIKRFLKKNWDPNMHIFSDPIPEKKHQMITLVQLTPKIKNRRGFFVWKLHYLHIHIFMLVRN